MIRKLSYSSSDKNSLPEKKLVGKEILRRPSKHSLIASRDVIIEESAQVEYIPDEEKFEFDYKKLNSLQRAVYDNDVKKLQKLLAEKDRGIDKLDTEHGVSSLFLACALGNFQMASLILENPKKSNPNLPNTKSNQTPLIQAVMADSMNLVRLLITKGADVNSKDNSKRTALFYTLHNKTTDIIQYLIQHNIELDSMDKFGLTPLHLSIKMRVFEHTKLIVEAGADLEARDEMRRSPFHLAIKTNNPEYAKLFLNAGAKIGSIDINGHTIWDYYMNSGMNDPDLTDLIVKARDKENGVNNTSGLLESLTRGASTIGRDEREETIRILTQENIDKDSKIAFLNQQRDEQAIRLNRENAEKVKLIQELRTEIESKNKTISDKEGLIKTKISEIEFAKSLINKEIDKLTLLETKHQETIKENDDLFKKSKENDTKKHKDEINFFKQTQINERKEYEKKESILQSELNQKSIQFEDSLKLKIKFEKELQESLKLNETKSNEIKRLNDKIKTAMGLETTVSTVQEELEKSELENKRLVHEIELMNLNLIGLQNTLNETQLKLNDSLSSEETLKIQFKRLEKQVNLLSSEKNGTVSEMAKELEKLVEEREEFILNISNLHQEIAKSEAK